MKYIRLYENTVAEIIPEFNPVFPNIPIGERYPAEFIATLVCVEDSVEVEQNYIYDIITGTFTEPEPIKPPTPEVPVETPVT